MTSPMNTVHAVIEIEHESRIPSTPLYRQRFELIGDVTAEPATGLPPMAWTSPLDLGRFVY